MSESDEIGARLAHALARDTGVEVASVRVVRAPYRFCPIGAHVDHQDGEVTGIALDRALHLAFVPSSDGRVTLTSETFEGDVRFSVGAIPDARPGDWGNYPRGAARALERRTALTRGMTGRIGGQMHPGGVSTSAALGVACLLALESANGLEMDATDNVELDRWVENEYLGLSNGILDQSVILRAREGSLVHLDCRTGQWALHAAPPALGSPALLAVFSGVRTALVDTGYNSRVAECRSAARLLLERGGITVPERPVLRDVPSHVAAEHLEALPGIERRRATHYFSEIDRVRRGLDAWREGDLPRFGEIVTATGRSSIDAYECGCPELVRLVELLLAQPGTYGARFSGAGFRGYAMAIVDPARAESIADVVRARYLDVFPEHAASFHTHTCRWADGATLRT